jgi:hypothetical protein
VAKTPGSGVHPGRSWKSEATKVTFAATGGSEACGWSWSDRARSDTDDGVIARVAQQLQDPSQIGASQVAPPQPGVEPVWQQSLRDAQARAG